MFLVASRHAWDTYWLPRSVCIIKGKSVLRIALAFSIVFITVETSIVSTRVHAIIFLANRSITQLRYTKPSLVHTYVMSVHQTAFGRSGLNCSLSMLWSSLLKSKSFALNHYRFWESPPWWNSFVWQWLTVCVDGGLVLRKTDKKDLLLLLKIVNINNIDEVKQNKRLKFIKEKYERSSMYLDNIKEW